MRGALGGTFIAHGVKHGRTINGTAGWFSSLGFRAPRTQAVTSAAVEVGSGVALLAGAATPLSTAAVVGTMGVAFKSVHQANGFFVINEGWEYVAVISAAAVTLSAIGPGRWSVDHRLGLDARTGPAVRALVTAGVGIGGAAAQLAAFWSRPDPR